MCYAAQTKGWTALLCAILAAAEQLDVLEDLKRHWNRAGPSMEMVTGQVQLAAPKAWRFIGEMHEIAETLEAAGQPDGFHRAAAEVYERLRGFKGTTAPALEEVIDALTAGKTRASISE
jgi:hypothetical protein